MQQAGFEIEPFFLSGEQGALFCIHLYPTDTAPKGGILYLHPFAEEMHKSRRMAALQARRFAAEGYAVLQVDLTGCGDSSGDFGDATWEAWHDDARRAHTWLLAKAPGPIILWGLRTGASLGRRAGWLAFRYRAPVALPTRRQRRAISEPVFTHQTGKRNAKRRPSAERDKRFACPDWKPGKV